MLFRSLVLVYVPLAPKGLRLLSRIDGTVGILIMVITVVGTARVLWGIKPADYYVHNYWFWTKIAFLSVISFWTFVPGIRVQRLHKDARKDPDYVASAADISYIRRGLWIEALLLIPVPIAAALMALGYGVV